jgi:hypothetical protein
MENAVLKSVVLSIALVVLLLIVLCVMARCRFLASHFKRASEGKKGSKSKFLTQRRNGAAEDQDFSLAARFSMPPRRRAAA